MNYYICDTLGYVIYSLGFKTKAQALDHKRAWGMKGKIVHKSELKYHLYK